MPADRLVHRWLLRGYWLQQDMRPRHRDHPAVHSQLHIELAVLELAQTPYPDGRGSPTEVGLSGKASAGAEATTWGSTACKQASPSTPAPQVIALKIHTV